MAFVRQSAQIVAFVLVIWTLSVTSLTADITPQPLQITIVGDSVTQTSHQFRSYRYNLWTKLVDADVVFDFVGTQDGNFNWSTSQDNVVPFPGWPDHQGLPFDRDHEAHWGWSSDDLLLGRDPGDPNLAKWL